MNKGALIWLTIIMIIGVLLVPMKIEVKKLVSQEIPYEKQVQSIDVYFEDIVKTKLVSKPVPYNTKGYRDYGNTTYQLYKEINITRPFFRYGDGEPSIPEIVEVENGRWLFTIEEEDNCTTSFRIFNPNYVPIDILVNYTIEQENKKYWEGIRKFDYQINLTLNARQYSSEIKNTLKRGNGTDQKEYDQFFGRGFCTVDEGSFDFIFINSTYINIKEDIDYEKIDVTGDKFYEFNYVGTKFELSFENVTVTETVPHTKIVNKTITDYKTVDRIVKKDEVLPIYLAIFVLIENKLNDYKDLKHN